MTLIWFTQMFNPQVVKLHCMCLKTIKIIMKGRSPTMRHVSRTHRVALDWLFDRINLDPKIQIKHIDTKNQLADMLTKGNFTRDDWNHLLCLFNISHFSSTVCSEGMAKRTQQDSGEERVTFVEANDDCYWKGPSTLSSSASESPVKRSYGNRNPWSAKAEKEDRTVQPVVGSDRKDCIRLLLSWAIYGKFLLSTLLKVGWWQSLVFSRVESW